MRHALFIFRAGLVSVFGIAASMAGQSVWHEEKGFRRADLKVAHEGKTGFTLLPPEVTGVVFTNSLDERAGEANRLLFNGSGVAVGDYDDDGLPDIDGNWPLDLYVANNRTDDILDCGQVDIRRVNGKREMFAQTPKELPIGAIDNRPQIMRNTLFFNCGDSTYAAVANYGGAVSVQTEEVICGGRYLAGFGCDVRFCLRSDERGYDPRSQMARWKNPQVFGSKAQPNLRNCGKLRGGLAQRPVQPNPAGIAGSQRRGGGSHRKMELNDLEWRPG